MDKIMLEYYQLRKVEREEKAREAHKKAHKCNRCVWSSYTGRNFVCMFSTCVKYKGFTQK